MTEISYDAKLILEEVKKQKDAGIPPPSVVSWLLNVAKGRENHIFCHDKYSSLQIGEALEHAFKESLEVNFFCHHCEGFTLQQKIVNVYQCMVCGNYRNESWTRQDMYEFGVSVEAGRWLQWLGISVSSSITPFESALFEIFGPNALSQFSPDLQIKLRRLFEMGKLTP